MERRTGTGHATRSAAVAVLTSLGPRRLQLLTAQCGRRLRTVAFPCPSPALQEKGVGQRGTGC